MEVGKISSNAGYSPQIKIGKAAEAAAEPSFFDQILDVVNPLQHIPLISNLYRSLTGDTMSTVSNIAGGALFGGPLGAAGAVASEMVQAAFNDENTSKPALAETKQATNTYTKHMRVTTADWLNPNFDAENGISVTA
jgi:hypothetical protein